MHDQILVGLVMAVPLLLVAWYANRMRHPARSFLSSLGIFTFGIRPRTARIGRYRLSLDPHRRRQNSSVRLVVRALHTRLLDVSPVVA